MFLIRRFALCVVFLFASSLAAQTPDFSAAREEMIRFLVDLIRIDTSNPPGYETQAAEYIKNVLAREGIQAEIFEKVPGRGNLVARLKGTGSKRPILLMAHLDVVGVEREKWTVEPFAGLIKDGYVYGRGAADDKNIVAAQLETLLLLHRLKVPLDRDVILLADAGEEGTTQVGIDFMVAEHWDKIDAEFAVNEGPTMPLKDGRVPWVGIATTEKAPRTTRLVARGTSGHGSIPRLDNPITHLAAAVGRIGTWQTPMRLNATTREFFTRLARVSAPQDAALYRNLLNPQTAEQAQKELQVKYPEYFSILRTSVVPTIIRGGFRENVIPGDAEATLDIRALPDEDLPSLYQKVRAIVSDRLVEVVPPKDGRPISPPSRIDTDMFRALESAQKQVFPDAVTVPMMVPFATDMAQLRAKGVQCYGFGPPAEPVSEGKSLFHGNDERISVEQMGKYLEFLYAAVYDVAGAH